MENKHEDINVSISKEFILRQNRFQATDNLKLRIKNKEYKILNYSTYGLAAICDIDLNLNESISEAALTFLGRDIQELALVIRRKEKSGDNFTYGFELSNSDIDIDRIQKTESLLTSIVNYEITKEKYKVLRPEFINLVNEMQIDLKNLEKLVKPIETEFYDRKESKELSYDITIHIVGDLMFEKIKNYNVQLQNVLDGKNTEELKIGLSYFRSVLGEFIFQSPFTKRSYEKPRGYAGDFEMMNQLYRNDNFSNTLFGSCVERAVNLHEEPQAVRNRSVYLKDKIVKEVRKKSNTKISTLSVASGPAEEVKLAISELTDQELAGVTFNLLDQDQEALLYAQRNIRSFAISQNKNVNLVLHNLAIKDVITGSLIESKFDLIYSAGLFDYFSNPVCSRAAKALAKSLTESGSLIIGNFNISAPNWFGMLALFDWKLILRSEADLKRLFTVDGCEVEVESEPSNVNLFCNIRKI